MDNLLTIGEFAKKAGITQRTLRFYDKIGLLKPSSYNAGGRRLYSSSDFARLQKILTLKYIGLSLDEIGKIIRYDVNESDIKKSLEIQRKIIDRKIHHMQMVVDTIDEALSHADRESDLNWDEFIKIINAINIGNNWMEQYENASNLRARMRIHELYSNNSKGWMQWFFEQMDIPENAKILEIGCGDGSLWAKNKDRIPSMWDITLTDFSEGMLKDAEKMLSDCHERFSFKVVDVQHIPYEDETFDAVIANHMLYHVQDMDRAFSEIHRVLKHGGRFYASTVGQNHMEEMRKIVSIFDWELAHSRSFRHTDRFQLENGYDKIAGWFKNVEIKRYEDNLFVTEPGPLMDYIFSMPGNIREAISVEKLEAILAYLEQRIKTDGGIRITKDTGFFQSVK